MKISPWLAGLHAALCGGLVFVALAAAGIQLNHRLGAGTGTFVAVGVSVVVMLGIAGVLLRMGSVAAATTFRSIGVAALHGSADTCVTQRRVRSRIQSFSAVLRFTPLVSWNADWGSIQLSGRADMRTACPTAHCWWQEP
jgi:hypothetical protein